MTLNRTRAAALLALAILAGAAATQIAVRSVAEARFARALAPYAGAFDGFGRAAAGGWRVTGLVLSEPPNGFDAIEADSVEVGAVQPEAGRTRLQDLRLTGANLTRGGAAVRVGRLRIEEISIPVAALDAGASPPAAGGGWRDLTLAGLSAESVSADVEGVGGRVSADRIVLDAVREGAVSRLRANGLVLENPADALRIRIGQATLVQPGAWRARAPDAAGGPLSEATFEAAEIELAFRGRSALRLETVRGGGSAPAPVGASVAPARLELAGGVLDLRSLAAGGGLDLAAALGPEVRFAVTQGLADAGDGRLAVSPFRVSAQGLFDLDLTAEIVRRTSAEAALGSLWSTQVASASWRYEDRSFFERMLAAAAAERGVSADGFRGDLLSDIRAAGDGFADPQAAASLAALASFIEQPGVFQVIVAPAAPVAIADIAFAAFFSPEAVFQDYGVRFEVQ